MTINTRRLFNNLRDLWHNWAFSTPDRREEILQKIKKICRILFRKIKCKKGLVNLFRFTPQFSLIRANVLYRIAELTTDPQKLKKLRQFVTRQFSPISLWSEKTRSTVELTLLRIKIRENSATH